MTLALWALVAAVIILAGVIAFLALIHGEVILQPRDLTDDQIREDIAPVASGVDVTPIHLVGKPS